MSQYKTEIRKEFQLERIIFFSDAVFAIAITLLIIDIRIPYHEAPFTNKQLWNALGEKIPQLVGFFISFFFIGGYWIIHHKMFGHVKSFDTRLIWLNLFFLLSIVLLPFTTSVFGMYGNLPAAFTIYVLNAVFTGIMNFLCWRHIVKPQRGLASGMEDRRDRQAAYARSLAMPVWFFICWVIALCTNVIAGEFSMPLIAVLFVIIGKVFKKKQPAAESEAN